MPKPRASGKPKAPKAAPSSLNASTLKLQRWIDLIAALLSRKYGTPFESLKGDVPGYASESDPHSVGRMFERDKDELRALGIPIEMLKNSADEDLGYVIDSREMYLPFLSLASSQSRTSHSVPRAGYRSLPTLTFEPDEMAAVLRGTQCGRALGDAALDADLESAVRKLTFDLSAGSAIPDVDPPHLRAAQDEHATALRVVGEALLRRKRVTFDYRSIGRDALAKRTAEPYGLFFHHGHWYLAARDTELGAVRNFRVSRMIDVEANTAKPQSTDFVVPAGFDLTAHAASREMWELGEGAPEEMVVELTGEGGATHAAEHLGAAIAGHPRRRSFQVRRRDAFVRWVLSFAGEIVPLSPPALVEEYRATARRTLSLYAEAAR
jgi:proteasome accessory factor B